MKKYTYTIIFILFNLAFVYSFFSRGDEDDIPVFLEEEYYQVYNIEYDDGITINRYKELFTGVNYDDYYIMGFKFNKEYNDKINNYIENIEIKGGNFLSTLEEYVSKYENILYLNNREDDINLIYNDSIRIKKIIVRCTRDVYDRIK